MRIACRPTMPEGRKALALAVLLAVGSVVWSSLGSGPFTEVSPLPAAAAVQQANELADQDVPGPVARPPLESVEPQRTEAGAPSDFSVVPKEAAPVREMLEAVRRRDLVALRDIYTPAIQQRIQKKGWSNHADEMVAAMTKFFGGLDPTAYGYSFLGDGERGVVKLYRSDSGASPGAMRVVRDGDRWLLDER